MRDGFFDVLQGLASEDGPRWIGLASRGVTREHLPRLVPLANTDFTSQTNPRPANAADYERLFLAAM